MRVAIVIWVGVALGLACREPERDLAPPASRLPRTLALARQKAHSLIAYNKPIPQAELTKFFSDMLGKPVDPGVFEALGAAMVKETIPLLWERAWRETPAGKPIQSSTMAAVSERLYPQELLVNADVVFFPRHEKLRRVVHEPEQDYLRDTALHWLWIERFVLSVDAGTAPAEVLRPGLPELDVYAAEVLSELVSVFAVAVLGVAGEIVEGQGTVRAEDVLDAHDLLASFGREPPRDPLAALPRFDPAARAELERTLPERFFADTTAASGLDFVHASLPEMRKRRFEDGAPTAVSGGGVAAADFDGDGDDDLFFAGGGGGRLYRNDAGRFSDVTAQAGLAPGGEGRAGYFIDYDNDGDEDLFLTFVGSSNRLYENRAGRYADVTAASGLDSGGIATHGAVWFDADADGLLDLYIGVFGAWQSGARPELRRSNSNADPNRLYHHRLEGGRHVFADVTAASGAGNTGWTHCVGAWDHDDDGDADLYVVNDFGRNALYENLGGLRFRDVSVESGLADPLHGMNFSLADVDGDESLELYISNIGTLTHGQRYPRGQLGQRMVFNVQNLMSVRVLTSNKLYKRMATGGWRDVHAEVYEPAARGWAWDADFLDFDNDGDPDQLILNGTAPMNLQTAESAATGARAQTGFDTFSDERAVFYVNQGGYFYDLSARSGLDLPVNDRGSAYLDYDGDGRLDVAVSSFEGPARIFHNDVTNDNSWVRFRLVGSRSNRAAIGAKLRLVTDRRRAVARVVSASGYLSQDPKAVHFGLLAGEQPLELEIVWPSGTRQLVPRPAPGAVHMVMEK